MKYPLSVTSVSVVSTRFLSTGILSASVLSLTMLSTPAHAGSDAIETAGDVLLVAIPLTALGSTYYMDDAAGRRQFATGFVANAGATYALKKLVDKERPDGSDDDSFPSGHTSIAFQSASFIHKRYGWEYAVPAYIGAGFVGYSRVNNDKHQTSDVLAGAVLGVASSMFLTKSYADDTLHVGASLSPESYQLAMSYKF